MTQHPYVGLAGTFKKKHGIIVAVGQGSHGGTVVLSDDGSTDEVDLDHFTPDDPSEARRRLTESGREWSGPDEWQVWHGGRCNRPSDDTYGKVPDGFTPIGPWKFVAVYETTDCGPASVWERPLRRVSP